MKTKTFHEACCERFGIGPDAFEEEVLWRCFYPHALWLGRFLWRWLRSYFADDLDLIRSVADCADANDVRTELSDYRYHHPVSGFLRRFLRVRASGQRLVDLATEVLSERHSDDSGRQRSCSEF